MTSDPSQLHLDVVRSNIKKQAVDPVLISSARSFFDRSHHLQYSYNFNWLGRPIIQYPQDIVAFQEIVSNVKPDFVLETGIAHGGSLVLSASILCLLDVMEGLDPRQSHRKVVGVDIDIRSHNRKALDNHPLRFKMELIEGSSVDPSIVNQARSHIGNSGTTIVSLDSNHTHDHVLAELDAYADLVSIGSYCIVYDTVIEDMPAGSFSDRPWDIGDNPKTALHQWLSGHPEFEIDRDIDNKLLISVAPEGFLKRIS